jgi:hypothetical protein
MTGAACAAMSLALAACGGGTDNLRPPITLSGVTYAVPDSDLSRADLRETEGGTGSVNFGSVIYVDDGTLEFLGTQTAAGVTSQFTADDGSVAFVTALPGFEETRLISQQFTQDGERYFSQGILGRFTSETRMATAEGEATYLGVGTAQVQVDGPSTFDLLGGNSAVTVDFGAGRVSATLDFSGTAAGTVGDIDRVDISGMSIDGNRFSGGRLTSSKDGATVGAYSDPAALSSSGIFAGWNDATGNVRDRSLPAEVGGAFVADIGEGSMTGRYLAD